MDEIRAKTKEQTRRQQTHEIRMNILRRDNEIQNAMNKSQQLLANSNTKYIEKIHTNDSILLKKYSIIELLTGIEIFQNNKIDQSWFYILFTNLTNQFLDSNWLKCENMRTKLQGIVSQLSGEVQDKYRNLFKVTLVL